MRSGSSQRVRRMTYGPDRDTGRVRLAVVLEQCLAPVPGGTGRYSREVAAALARTAGAGDEAGAA